MILKVPSKPLDSMKATMSITNASCEQPPTARDIPRPRRFCRQPLKRTRLQRRTRRGTGGAPAAAPPRSLSCGTPAREPSPARPGPPSAAAQHSPVRSPEPCGSVTRDGHEAAFRKETTSEAPHVLPVPQQGAAQPKRAALTRHGGSAGLTQHGPRRRRKSCWKLRHRARRRANARLLLPASTTFRQAVVGRLFSRQALWEL